MQNGKAKVKTSLKLEPVGANVLKGTEELHLTPQAVVTIFVELPGQKPSVARFVPLKLKTKTNGRGESMSTREFKLGK